MQAQNGLQVAQAAYNRAVGRPLGEPVNLAELSVEQGVEDIGSLTHRALQLRPELAQISAQACALRDQAAGEQAKKGPQVAVVGGYVFQQNRYLDPDGLAGVAVMAEWNVIDSGRVCNRAASLSEKAEGLIRLRMDLESMVALDVRQKWLDLQTALARIDVARQATEQADENLQTARNRYRQQVGTNTEVLDAEALRVQAFTNYYNSVYEAVLARLRLARAVGEI
jgi:outer membrane protein TolC